MKLVVNTNLNHLERYGWACGVFCHGRASVQFQAYKKDVAKRGRRRNPQWFFTTSAVQTPTVIQQHEMPIIAAFLLECHQRLSASIRDNNFNPKALENK